VWDLFAYLAAGARFVTRTCAQMGSRIPAFARMTKRLGPLVMNKSLLLAAALPFLALSVAAPAQQSRQTPVERLREAALADNIAYDIVEGLTTEVGPRLAGTEQEARARDWAVRKLRSLGFSNVRVEEFDMPVWVRGQESASIVAPYQQPLALTRSAIRPRRPRPGWRPSLSPLPAWPISRPLQRSACAAVSSSSPTG
jgi:hypothetical protein